jgi:hypothetical protein
MDNRINEIRRQIRALRVSMLETEAIMHEQINRDEECSFVAGEVLKMRAVMSLLVRERTTLGDREPILVNNFFVPRRQPTPWAMAAAPCPAHPLNAVTTTSIKAPPPRSATPTVARVGKLSPKNSVQAASISFFLDRSVTKIDMTSSS